MTEKRRKPLFERLKAGLEAGIEFSRGERTLRTIEYPSPPPEVTGEDVVRLRERLKVSQTVLAGLLNVSPKTVQSWEQGVRTPSHSALRVIQILKKNPGALFELAGICADGSGEKSDQPASGTKSRRGRKKPRAPIPV